MSFKLRHHQKKQGNSQSRRWRDPVDTANRLEKMAITRERKKREREYTALKYINSYIATYTEILLLGFNGK